jgi:DNA polymerase-3 subunit gamma/tau
MSYQVLARKWRPKKFQQLMGQEHVVTVLTNALTQQRLHHAYLFTGTRGVGKTTIARIFAKSLNCQQGISAEPCGECDICLDIDQGRFVDLLEIDAASRTKVDDTREILDNVQYAPSRGRYKVYLIDEVHMLSRSSFNALLKTLEEPPEHVKFILATTDPQKLPITVLSRCLQFHLKALTAIQIKTQLSVILSAEKVEVESAALSLIAKNARGSMRDSLSITDQALAQGLGKISLSNVQQMLGGIDQNWPYKIVIALIKQDGQSLMSLSQSIASYAPNYSRLLAELIQLFHQIAMAQIIDSSFDLSIEHTELITKFTQALSPETVQLYYQITLTGRKDLPYTADEQAAFDMTLLRLLAFKPLIAGNIPDTTMSVTSALKIADELSSNHINTTPVEKNDPTLATATAIENSYDHIESTLPVNEEPSIAIAASIEPVLERNMFEGNEQLVTEQLSEQMLDIEQSAQAQGLLPDTTSQDVIPDNNMEKNTSSTAVVESKATSAIEAMLAQRNMLRSKKKQQEQPEKKFESANVKPIARTPEAVSQSNTGLELLVTDQETYTPEVIDPAIIRSASQVDKWANMIDNMALGGRLRQLAIHATICESSTAERLVLQLNQQTKHLKSDVAHEQLEVAISTLLEKKVAVEINVVEDTVADPYQIQTDINHKRFEYAKDLLNNDQVVNYLKTEFQAELDEGSIIAR